MSIKKTNKKILIVAGYGMTYGMGHWLRCTLLKQYLLKIFLQVDLIKLNEFFHHETISYSLIIFDIRDVTLKSLSIYEKKNQSILFIDNMAKKNSTCNYWLTLPHVDFPISQNLLLLNNILIPQEMLRKRYLKAKKNNSKLHLLKKRDARQVDFDLFKSKRSSQKKFIKKLLKAQSIRAYFGQTVFESIYLKVANIYLEPITPYHFQLNQLLVKLHRSKSFYRNLTGQGYKRLISRITQLLA